MQINFSPRDPKNYHRLKNLPADEAIRSYLEGRFTIGEETALVEAVQRGMSLSIEKDVIEDILAECMLYAVSLQECKSRLIEGLVKYGD
jgi:hypothetical protein